MTYVICDETRSDIIAGILEKHIGISKESSKYAFDIFREGRRENPYPKSLEIPIDTLKYDKKQIGLDVACCHGIDIPIWYENSNSKAPRIMFIAMDPNRNDLVDTQAMSYASVNSPFTLHLKDENSPKDVNRYWNNVKQLIESYSVYVTDIYKLFFRSRVNTKNKSNEIKSYTTLSTIHTDTLKAEIEAFNPHFIMCLGSNSFNAKKSITKSKAKEKITEAKFIDIAENVEDWSTPVFGITHNSGNNGHFTKYLKDLEGVDANNYYVGMADLIAKKLKIK